MRFKIKNSEIFPMPGNPHLLHLGTIEYGLREFVVMLHIANQSCYIEEVVLNNVDFSSDVFAGLKFIDDDSLANDLAKFAEEKGIIDIPKRIQELVDRNHLDWIMLSNEK
jgi:hypothetical protein